MSKLVRCRYQTFRFRASAQRLRQPLRSERSTLDQDIASVVVLGHLKKIRDKDEENKNIRVAIENSGQRKIASRSS